MFVTSEPDESTFVPVISRQSFVDDIRFGDKSFKESLVTHDRLLVRFTECRISTSFTKNIFVQPQVDFLRHKVIAQGIAADPKKRAKLTEWSFPASVLKNLPLPLKKHGWNTPDIMGRSRTLICLNKPTNHFQRQKRVCKRFSE